MEVLMEHNQHRVDACGDYGVLQLEARHEMEEEQTGVRGMDSVVDGGVHGKAVHWKEGSDGLLEVEGMGKRDTVGGLEMLVTVGLAVHRVEGRGQVHESDDGRFGCEDDADGRDGAGVSGENERKHAWAHFAPNLQVDQQQRLLKVVPLTMEEIPWTVEQPLLL